MSKMNNRGFLLAESLIVSTFVLTVLMFLFVQFRNIVSNYKTSYIYNSVEDIYSLGSLADYLKIHENTSNTLNTQLEGKNFFYIYNENKCTNDFVINGEKNLCSEIGNAIGLEYAIYTNSNIKEIKKNMTALEGDMQNFIKKVDTTDVQNEGRLIAKFKNGHYATIAVNVAKERLIPLIKAFGETDTLMGSTGIDKASITSIIFENNLEIPRNVQSWDVSDKNDESVMAWVTGGNTLHIGGDGGVIANADSSYLFNGFNNVTSINLENFITTTGEGENKEPIITNMSHMFANCWALESLNLSNFDTSNVTDMQNMFYECNGLTNLDLSNFITSKVSSMFQMFRGCDNLAAVTLGDGWRKDAGTNAATANNMSQMFHDCFSLNTIDLTKLYTANVTNMSYMFHRCWRLQTLDFSNFNTSNVTDMHYMFYGCEGLTSLNLSNFNTSKVTKMSQMFQDCLNLTNLDLSSFDTSKVDTVEDGKSGFFSMFDGCSSLKTLNLKNFKTKNITDTNSMFNGCSNLETIYVSDTFTVDNVTKSASMFNGCSKLKGGNGTSFDANHKDKEYARIDATGTPGYFTRAS